MIPGTLCDARIFRRQRHRHAALARFEGHLLLVSGARDRLCPAQLPRAMLAAQPRALWLELPRVGHFVPLEAGARLSHLLRAWIQA